MANGLHINIMNPQKINVKRDKIFLSRFHSVSLSLPLRFSLASTPFLSRFHSVSLSLPLRFSLAKKRKILKNKRIFLMASAPKTTTRAENKSENNNNARRRTRARSFLKCRVPKTIIEKLLLFFFKRKRQERPAA
jgi:hypothetical protein